VVSVYGSHLQGWGDDVKRWHDIARPVVVKLVALQDAGLISYLVKAANDGWLKHIVLRSDPGDVPINFSQDVETQAQATAQRNLGFARAFQNAGLGPLLWLEGCNEVAVFSADRMSYYATHEAIRSRIIAGAGLRALCFQFATGNPPLELWDGVVEQLRTIKAAGGGLALHAYNQPDLLTYSAEYYIARHVTVYSAFPEDLRDLPLFLTEFGIDGGVGGGDPNWPGPPPRPGHGWRSYTDEPGFTQQLKDAEGVIRMPAALKGATLFTFRGGGWESFEMTGTTMIARYIGDKNKEEPPVTPAIPREYDPQKEWQDYQNQLGGIPMFKKVALQENLGEPISGEYDRGPYRFQRYVGGIVWAPIGQWHRTRVARSASELPPKA
jgi:hypothetical protein